MKTLYKIQLNWKGEQHCYYRYVSSEKQALRSGISQLSKELGMSTYYIKNNLLGTDSIKIVSQ